VTRRIIVYAIVLLLLAVIGEESAFRITLWGVKPDLLLVFVVVVSLQGGPLSGGLSALAAGWMQAASLGIAVGSIIVSKAASGLAAAQVEPHVVKENFLTSAPVAFFATWVCEVVFFIFYPQVWGPRWPLQVALESVLNALVAPLLYLVLEYLAPRKESLTL